MTTALRVIPIAILIALCGPAFSEETNDAERNSTAFIFGGVLTTDDMLSSASPLTVGYESNGIVGAGFQSYFHDFGWARIGGEIGVASRFGKGSSTAEIWAGPVMRMKPFEITDDLFLTPSLTAGLSVVNGVQPGREADQEQKYDGNADVLFYLGRLCCTNRVRDSSCESKMVAVMHEQTHTHDLQDQELASLQ